ncbi:MAG: zf-TFIIB domain-containing protein [Ignavibacteriae bacterium]|nr:zf-TFIIB domain-containing protein [Ignavibacteriota bacterium]
MKCPICKEINLVISTRDGVEIDYCPECRGIWLDRGELDKIIEASQKYEKNNQQYQKSYSENHQDNKHNYSDEKQHDGRYKKKSFLGDMFDF